MKRFFIRLAAYLCILLICYVGFIAIFASFGLSNRNIYTKMGISPSFLPSRIKEIQSNDFKHVDVLFCGSSGAYRDFDVRLFKSKGINCFNMGSSAQTPLQTEVLLHRYIDQLSPKMIVFEVSPDLMDMTGIESSIELISSDYFGLDFLKMCISQESIYCMNTMVYGILYDLCSREEKYADKVTENEKRYAQSHYVSGGYVETLMETNKDCSKVLPSSPVHIRHDQMKSLINCIELAKSRNIPYMLVECPVSSNLYKSYAGHDSFVKEMSELGVFVDYNSKPFLNDSLHFYDLHHLNQVGVSLFNQQMIQQIDSFMNQGAVR